MTRALLTGCLLGACFLAGYAYGAYRERRRRIVVLPTGLPPNGPRFEPTADGLWRLREGGAL